MTKTKQVTRMEVDGSVVDIRPIEREETSRSAAYYINAAGEHVPCDPDIYYRQKSLYEVYVDDVHRGWVQFPMGWGGEWSFYSLRPQHERFDPSYNKHDAEEKARYGIQGYYRVLSPGALNEPENWGEHRKSWADRNDILAHLPKLVAMGRAPDAAEMKKRYAQWEADHAQRVREDAEKKELWARERAEKERRAAEDAARAEEERVETLEGLVSIQERFLSQLTNHEANAIARAIERFTK